MRTLLLVLLLFSTPARSDVIIYFACDEMRGVVFYGYYLPAEFINQEILDLMAEDITKGGKYTRVDLESVAPDRLRCEPFI